MLRNVMAATILSLSVIQGGCAPIPATAPPAIANPVFIPSSRTEDAWERTVDVIHAYQFPIARENKLDGIIETDYKVGAGVLEPWHRDSVGFDNQLESSLQSIRRRAFINLTPVQGGYLVGINVFKEREDMAGLAANTPGGATFQESTPLERDLNLVVGQSTPSGWIALGRDVVLEQQFLSQLQAGNVR